MRIDCGSAGGRLCQAPHLTPSHTIAALSARTWSSDQSQGRPPMKSLWGESCTTVLTTSSPPSC